MTKGSGTRSGLLWEVERLLNETKELPQVLLMENVPQVHGEKNKDDFKKWQEYLGGAWVFELLSRFERCRLWRSAESGKMLHG